MKYSRRKACRFVLTPRVGVLLACVVVSSTSLSFTVASPAEALSTGTVNSKYFAGYVTAPSDLSSAQVTIVVPTLTCANDANKEQDVFIFQSLEITQGYYGDAWVDAECYLGSPDYVAFAGACGFTSGCGNCSGISVSPGDSVLFSENAGNGMDAFVEGTVSDITNHNSASCTEMGSTPGTLVYTGICDQDHIFHSARPGSTDSATPVPFDGCLEGKPPKFSPVAFTGATGNGDALSSFGPTQYDMVSGSTLQVKTRSIKDSGESFKDVFLHH